MLRPSILRKITAALMVYFKYAFITVVIFLKILKL